MTKKEAKIKMLITMWGWATNHCDGIENGELSDVLDEDVRDGRYTVSQAKKIQNEFFEESERIQCRLQKLRQP